jgi:hypothetical protein
MTWVEFEPTIPASERAKTVHALDRSATVAGTPETYNIPKFFFLTQFFILEMSM